MRTKFLLYAFFVFLAAKASLLPAAEPASLTEQQEKILAVALKDFRGAPQQRTTAAKRALSVGPLGAQRLLEKIEAELEPQLAKYREVCTKLAAAEYAKRSVTPEKLVELRTKVLDLRKEENLTKEKIVEVADPVIKELAALILVDRISILSASPEVRRLRPQLSLLAPYWEACQAFMANSNAAEAKPAAANAKNAPAPTAAPTASFESFLQQQEIAALLQVSPVDPASLTVLTDNLKDSSQMRGEELNCLTELNVMRVLLGLMAVRFDPLLLQASRDHSRDMAEKDFFAHESPVAGKKTPWDRAKLANTTASAENIAMGQDTGKEANIGWFHSPGHFKNMLGDDHRRAAIGNYQKHWTEMFGQ